LMINAVKYMDDHYMEDLNIEDISKRFLLSQSYFSYLFKTFTLKTFTEYLSDIRMSHAMELLQLSDKRVIDICFEVGFNNVDHFIRQFKKYTGRSPLSYRKSRNVGTDSY
jgi:two-component system, response regulator YesN